MFEQITYLRRRLESSQGTGLLIVASTLGVFVALGIWFYRSTIEFFREILQGVAVHTLSPVFGVFSIVVVLAAAGFVVGLIMDRYVGKERHHGVAGIVEAVAVSGGRLNYVKLPFKAFASALSLGAGASAGPEDPSVQIGANTASWIGRLLNLREESLRLLVAAGAAGGIAAAFKAPIAGVFFALEVILNGSFGASSISAVVICAVMSSAATSALEPGVEMGPFNYQLGGPLELWLFLPLGLVVAVVATVYIRGVYWQQDLWDRYVTVPRPVRTAIAGVLIGAMGIFMPQILGIGRETMNLVLEGASEFGVGLLILLCAAKILSNIVSLAGGFVGGVFAPALFAGTMLGSAYGQVVDQIFGVHVGDPQAYAIAGMAGMLAGVLRAPITAIMMVFELTNDYRLILPIMLTTIVGVVVADRFEKYGIYSLGLARQGVRLQPGREIDMMQGVTVAEAMVTPPPTIAETATLLELRNSLRAQHTNSICVLDADGRLAGVVTLSDLQRAYDREDAPSLTVGAICSRDLTTVHPEDELWAAIRLMSANDVGRLPVVRRGTMELLGLIGRHGVLRAYNIAITRKIRDQHLAERIRLNNLTGGHVFEMIVHENSPAAGKHIKEIVWPAECVVASITRHGRLLVPHGSTMLHVGDHLSLVADHRVEAELMSITGSARGEVREH